MEYATNPYATPQYSVAALAAEDERAGFIAKTYFHLVGAIAALVMIEFVLLQTPLAEPLVGLMMASRWGWLIVLGMFMGTSWLANSWALSATSLSKQYLGLGIYVVAQAIILLPLLYVALSLPQYAGVVPVAAATTVGLFAALTGVVFMTRKDFSFLRSLLLFGGLAAIGAIVCSIVFNFTLGVFFAYAMIALTCGYILYDTSNVLHHYRIGQHVAASLALFASVALLFFYVLRVFMYARD